MLTLVAGWDIMEARPMGSPDRTEIENPLNPGSRLSPEPRVPAAVPAVAAAEEPTWAEAQDCYQRFLTALLRGLSVWHA